MSIFLSQQYFLFFNNCYFQIIKSFPTEVSAVQQKLSKASLSKSSSSSKSSKSSLPKLQIPSRGLQTTQGPFTHPFYIKKKHFCALARIWLNIEKYSKQKSKSKAEKSQKSWISPLRENRCLVAFLKSAQYILENVGERENPVFCIIWGKKQELCMVGCTSWYCNICKVCF